MERWSYEYYDEGCAGCDAEKAEGCPYCYDCYPELLMRRPDAHTPEWYAIEIPF